MALSEAVLLLHSSGMSSRQWGRLGEVLGPTHRVIAPDLLGSGANPPWPKEKLFDLSEDVDAVEALVEGLSEPVHLVGHSYGGLLALKLARRDPSRVRSLTAYDPVAFGVLYAANDAEGLADLARAGDHPVFTDFAHGGNDAWFEAPSLLLGGETSPPAARRVVALLAKTLPRGRVLTGPGAGHMGPLTHAAFVNDAIAAHLASAPQDPAPCPSSPDPSLLEP